MNLSEEHKVGDRVSFLNRQRFVTGTVVAIEKIGLENWYVCQEDDGTSCLVLKPTKQSNSTLSIAPVA
jgi:hypothetical protein